MVRTSKKLGIAAIRAAHAVAAVAAQVQKSSDAPAQVAPQDDRLLAHIGGNEVARIGNFALMAEIEPAAGEEALALQLIYLAVSKDTPINETGFWINKRLDLHPNASFDSAIGLSYDFPIAPRQLAKHFPTVDCRVECVAIFMRQSQTQVGHLHASTVVRNGSISSRSLTS